mmetsp:Transcript_37925/g.107162  ORF Transcript_37925/g.107162 Transcript_37925/m.107162 type:complete len:120 (+) Transcript_37925:92-451(+)
MNHPTEAEVVDYFMKHNIVGVFEALSSILVSHRPERPWKTISDSLSFAISAELTAPDRNKGKESFVQLLEKSAPPPPIQHSDGGAPPCTRTPMPTLQPSPPSLFAHQFMRWSPPAISLS